MSFLLSINHHRSVFKYGFVQNDFSPLRCDTTMGRLNRGVWRFVVDSNGALAVVVVVVIFSRSGGLVVVFVVGRMANGFVGTLVVFIVVVFFVVDCDLLLLDTFGVDD